MRKAFLVVLAVVAIAVYLMALPDPEKSPLESGSKAVVSRKSGALLQDSTSQVPLFPNLLKGTRVTVKDDPATHDKSEQGSFRPISVYVESGEFRGLSGKVNREE